MIVKNMGRLKVANEIFADLSFGIGKKIHSLLSDNKYRRAVLKHGKNGEFQFFEPITIKSKRQYEYVLVPYSCGRSKFKKRGIQYMLFTIINLHGAINIARIFDNRTKVAFYTEHVLERYVERFIECEEEPINQEFVIDLFKQNLYNTFCRQGGKRKESDLMFCINDGVLLGTVIASNVVVYNTFITFDMLKGEQIDKVEALSERLDSLYSRMCGDSYRLAS